MSPNTVRRLKAHRPTAFTPACAVAIGAGYRELKESWCELLLDMKKRGLPAGPLLVCGDGAMGFWSAMEKVFPQTKHQRCWFHKIGNIAQRVADVSAEARGEGAARHLDGDHARRHAGHIQ